MGIESSLLISAKTSSAAWKNSALEVAADAPGAEAEGAADCEGGADGVGGAEAGDCCAQAVATINIAAHTIASERRNRIMFDLRGGIEAFSSAMADSPWQNSNRS